MWSPDNTTITKWCYKFSLLTARNDLLISCVPYPIIGKQYVDKLRLMSKWVYDAILAHQKINNAFMMHLLRISVFSLLVRKLIPEVPNSVVAKSSTSFSWLVRIIGHQFFSETLQVLKNYAEYVSKLITNLFLTEVEVVGCAANKNLQK